MMKLSSNISRPMVLLLLAGLVSAFVLVRTAWLCEDAYITFRTIDNWVNGYGLRWNVDERVQVYTHPLWMLALSAVRLATGEFYYATLGLSLMLSLSALALLATGLAATTLQGLLAVVLLTGSRAFVDFSSSGLENPLTHLLLLGHLWIFLRHHGSRRILWLTMTAAWLATNRPDTVLLVLPTLVAALSRAPWRTARGQLLVGALPLVLWEGFSIIYYGFPFPNTAYAKLGSGVAQSDLVAQGLFYLVDSLRRDPITISTIVVGIVAPWVRGSKSRRAMAAGAAIHLLYVVAIGGDFMSGRFLTPVLLASIAVLVSAPLAGRIPAWTAAVVALYLVTMPSSPLHSGNDYESKEEFSAHHGITDERGYWYQYTGLLRAPTTGSSRRFTRGPASGTPTGVRWQRASSPERCKPAAPP